MMASTVAPGMPSKVRASRWATDTPRFPPRLARKSTALSLSKSETSTMA